MAKSLTIGLDARPTQGPFTGDATYWRGLIEGLSRVESADEFIIYLDAQMPEPEIDVTRSMRTRLLAACCSRVWSAWTFPRALRQDGVEVAHVQYTIPPFMPCPTVTTIQDISFKRFPRFFGLKDRLILDLGVRWARSAAARIIVPSEHTKKEIVQLYRVDPDKISVIHLGVDRRFEPVDRDQARQIAAERYGIRSPYVLTVGVIQPRKNLGRLLDGFAGLKGIRQTNHKLVIVGKPGWKETNLQRRIDELGLGEDVIFTGYVPREDLPALYSGADAFVYPSVYEGFGLPPLEAMACGTPVITGNRSSLPEVVGEAGIMVDPYDAEAFARAMANVLSSESLRNEMSALGIARAAKFTWDETARETLEVYHSVGEHLSDG
jgi:glycosyltransferase involved in cell wall biosynthesis